MEHFLKVQKECTFNKTAVNLTIHQKAWSNGPDYQCSNTKQLSTSNIDIVQSIII